ncbi:pilus motility taxis protein HmpF [Pleurocapsa sp. FMAR1]|uniref:pilus motility taxis protein HmpF n=1 Tax=Pleurocapsa sp. FMAR1 TaxID=3040204 RepID=UPI0029C61D1A|nr:pilus motility taxis protein HmpF [Pleurocapsa sp. FMAR1]
MLYLAEVQKQSKGFMGGTDTKLKLIACQRNDESWSVVGNESIAINDASDFGDGALVAVNLGVNRQIQGNMELASPKIVGILKNFSRLLEKTKDQEQEIEQWKESLERQSEELSIRQIEMETRLEQVEHMEEEFEQFEQQREEIAVAKAETEKARAEFATKSTELQGAWQQLRGQQQNLDEQLKESKVLNESQAATIKENLSVLAMVIDSSKSFKSKLDLAAEAVENQQEILQPHWQNLTQYSQDLQIKRQELKLTDTELAAKNQKIQPLIASIAEIGRQLGIEQKSLEAKQELTQFLNVQSDAQNSMISMLAGSESDSNAEQKVSIKELENMPLPNLEEMVANLKKDLEKVALFVNDQEEELGWQCKAVEELEAKIANMAEFERFTLEQELADELEAKKMLDQTLVGQRRSLKERYNFLLQHSRVLKRRQGIIDFDLESAIEDIDLTPIKQGLEKQSQKLQQQQQELAQEVAQVQENIKSLEAKLNKQQTEKSELESAFVQQQDTWRKLNFDVVQIQSQIDFYQQELQPLQDALDAIGNQVSQMEQLITNDAEPGKAVLEIEQIINEITAT